MKRLFRTLGVWCLIWCGVTSLFTAYGTEFKIKNDNGEVISFDLKETEKKRYELAIRNNCFDAVRFFREKTLSFAKDSNENIVCTGIKLSSDNQDFRMAICHSLCCLNVIIASDNSSIDPSCIGTTPVLKNPRELVKSFGVNLAAYTVSILNWIGLLPCPQGDLRPQIEAANITQQIG